MLTLVALLLRFACIRNYPFAVDKLVYMVLASALELLESVVELLLERVYKPLLD